MTLNDWKLTAAWKDPENRKRILEAFGQNVSALGELGCPKPQPHAIPALEQKPKARHSGASGVAVVVSFVSVRKQLLDSDNLTAAHKGLRDAVARSLGVDDADPRIRWEYSQAETRGAEGTIVHISCK